MAVGETTCKANQDVEDDLVRERLFGVLLLEKILESACLCKLHDDEEGGFQGVPKKPDHVLVLQRREHLDFLDETVLTHVGRSIAAQ